MSIQNADVFDGAPCRTVDPDLFFPETKAESIEPKLLCEQCPLSVKKACARAAVESSAIYGVWAGEYLSRSPHKNGHKEARRAVEAIAGLKFRTRPERVEKKESVEKVVVRMSLQGFPVPEIASSSGVSERQVLRIRKSSEVLRDRRCSECDRFMVSREAAMMTYGQAKVGAGGMCTACYQRHRRTLKVAS
jgi:hypothetical protein